MFTSYFFPLYTLYLSRKVGQDLIVLLLDLYFTTPSFLFTTFPVYRECLGEAHEPCDCQMWRNWLQKVTEMKPEERKSMNLQCL